MALTTDPRCGKTYRANDQDGHCTRCHRTFAGEVAFTRHHKHPADRSLVCEDPETARDPEGVAVYGLRDRPGTTDQVAYGIGPKGGFPTEAFSTTRPTEAFR